MTRGREGKDRTGDLLSDVEAVEAGRILMSDDITDEAPISRDAEIRLHGDAGPSPQDLFQAEYNNILSAGGAAFDRVVTEREASRPTKTIYCTCCGVELDQEHTLNYLDRAALRRCTNCIATERPIGSAKHCRTCGKMYTLEHYLADYQGFRPPEERERCGRKGWPTWSSHRACQLRVDEERNAWRREVTKAAQEARRQVIVERVLRVPDPRLKRKLARRFRIKL